jgi:RNA polymerase sigma-70 factor (ECF subfamily)
LVPNSAEFPDGVDEAALVARAQGRDRDAIAAVMTRYNRRLYRVARSIMRNDEDAEDALQAAYLKAFNALPRFRGESSIGTWLTRIVINEALAMRRGTKMACAWNEGQAIPGSGRIVAFPLAGVDPEKSLAQRQIQALIEQAIDELPDAFRTVLVARVLEQMSVEETAAALSLRAETVKTRLHRARHLLREAIERRVGPLILDVFPFDGWRCRRMTERVLEKLGFSF